MKNLRERDQLGDTGLGGRIILRSIFGKWDVGLWTIPSWLRIRRGGGNCECGNAKSGSMQWGNFFTS